MTGKSSRCQDGASRENALRTEDRFPSAQRVHLAQRDVSFGAVSRAPPNKIEAFKKRMSWRFAWVSSFETDFNHDYHPSFTQGEMAKARLTTISMWWNSPAGSPRNQRLLQGDKNGSIFHTYSAYARGTESVFGTYNCLGLVPKRPR